MPGENDNAEEVLTIIGSGSPDGEALVEDGALESFDAVIKGNSATDKPSDDDAVVVEVDSGESDDDAQSAERKEKKEQVQIESRSEDGPIEGEGESGGKGPDNEGLPEDREQNRDRLYLGKVEDPVRKETIRLLAQSPSLTPAEAEDMAKKILGIKDESSSDGTVTYDELSTKEKIEFDSSELKEIGEKIIELERAGDHSDEWSELMKKKDELILKIAENNVSLRFEEKQKQDEARVADSAVEVAEKQIAEEFPDILVEGSPLFVLVQHRSSKIMDEYRQGKAPEWFNPKDPEALKRIAREQAELIGLKKKEPVAKPGSAAGEDGNHRPKGPLPSKSSSSSSQRQVIQGASPIQIKVSGSDDDFLDSLDRIASGRSEQAPRRNSGKFEIV